MALPAIKEIMADPHLARTFLAWLADSPDSEIRYGPGAPADPDLELVEQAARKVLAQINVD